MRILLQKLRKMEKKRCLTQKSSKLTQQDVLCDLEGEREREREKKQTNPQKIEEEKKKSKDKNGKECPGEISQALIYKNTSCYAKLERKKTKQNRSVTWRPVNNLHLYKTTLFTGVP